MTFVVRNISKVLRSSICVIPVFDMQYLAAEIWIMCILRSPADSDAFQSGCYAEHNGRSKTLDFIV